MRSCLIAGSCAAKAGAWLDGLAAAGIAIACGSAAAGEESLAAIGHVQYNTQALGLSDFEAFEECVGLPGVVAIWSVGWMTPPD